MSAINSPAKPLLDANLELKSFEHINLALKELSWIESLEKHLDGGMELELEKIRGGYVKKKIRKIGGKDVPFADRRKQLCAAIEAYCTEHRKLVCDVGVKSRKFSHGTIGWTKIPLSLQYADDGNAKSTLKTIVEKLGLTKLVNAFLEPLRVFRKPLEMFVSLQPKLELTKIKTAYKDEKISKDVLAELGLKAVGGDESEAFFVKVNEYVSRSEETKHE